MKPARASMVLLAIQLVLVSSIAAKYLIDRSHNPRAWAPAVAFDPELIMRGRYISARLKVDVCNVAQPSDESHRTLRALPIEFDALGNVLQEHSSRYLLAVLGSKNGRLGVQRFTDDAHKHSALEVLVPKKPSVCTGAILAEPVSFYLSETAKSPFPLQQGQQLWVQLTIPPSGPPSPISLAIQTADGKWQPLNFQ